MKLFHNDRHPEFSRIRHKPVNREDDLALDVVAPNHLRASRSNHAAFLRPHLRRQNHDGDRAPLQIFRRRFFLNEAQTAHHSEISRVVTLAVHSGCADRPGGSCAERRGQIHAPLTRIVLPRAVRRQSPHRKFRIFNLVRFQRIDRLIMNEAQ